jgi:hypothetical protein
MKIVAYVLPDKGKKGPPGHKFLTLRRTKMSAGQRRYVDIGEFWKVGLTWRSGTPTGSREALAKLIGEAILDEAGV